jgi:glycogen debranching enzyme
VARDDPAFDPDRMWRGPVWLNVNRLLAEGLRTSGHADLANELVERTLDMVVRGGGMHEHWNPLTGTRPPTATSCFSWSASLFIDLAVSATGGGLA